VRSVSNCRPRRSFIRIERDAELAELVAHLGLDAAC
jgi:hypothetical protein